MEYEHNLITLPRYTPLFVSPKDGSAEYILLNEDTQVDDQRKNIKESGYFGYEGILDYYWDWSYPLIINCHLDIHMISKHGLDLKKQMKDAIQSLIVSCPYSVAVINELFDEDLKIYTHTIKRVKEGSPVLIVPESLMDPTQEGVVSEIAEQEIFQCEEHMKDIHARFCNPNSIGQSYDDQVYITTPGLMKLYIDHYQPSSYTVTTMETDRPIWLYGDNITYIEATTLEYLLFQLSPYMYTRFQSIPNKYVDVVISHI